MRHAPTYTTPEAATGPGRLLLAPASTAVSAVDAFGVVPVIRNAQGEYPVALPWFDTGLQSDSMSINHNTDSEGIEFENVDGALFQKVTSIEQTVVTTLASLHPKNLALIDNVNPADIVEVAAAPGKPAHTKIPIGVYERLRTYRGLVVFSSASDREQDMVIEPGGHLRPPTFVRTLPLLQLAAEERELEIEKGSPASCEVTLSILPELSLPTKERLGGWYLEKPGQIPAAA